MFKKLSHYLAIAALLLVVSGCAFLIPQPSQEQMMQQQQIYQRMLRARQQPQQSNTISKEFTITEEELVKKITSLPTLTQGIDFIRKKDGFEYNGKRYLDPEGPIVAYGFDPKRGDVTYLSQTSENNYVIKFVRVSTNTDPITIATANKNGDYWNIQTVTGKKLSGETVTPLSLGFLVARDATAFIYTPGSAIGNFAAPEGFAIANFQNGEVSQTRYILVERIPEESGGIVNSVKSLGASFGINKKEDYMLVNIDDDTKIPLNIDVDGKKVASHSGCRKKNSYMNECANVDFYESLFDKYGMPNGEHYFWRVSWFQGNHGSFLVVRDGGTVFIQDMKTSKKVEAFKRVLGINWIDARRTADGKVEITAQLGLKKETMADAEKVLADGEVAKN